MGEQLIDIAYLQKYLFALGYRLDGSQANPIFWKKIQHSDLKNALAFSLVMVVLDKHSLRIEGLNEPRLQRAIRQGLIEVNSQEEVEALKEVVFEATFDQRKQLEVVMPFFEQQLAVIAQEPVGSDAYKKAIDNIALLVDAANEIEQ